MKMQINSGIVLLSGSRNRIFCQAAVNSHRCIQLWSKIGRLLPFSSEESLMLSDIQGILVPCSLRGPLHQKRSPNLQLHLVGPC